MSGSHGFAAGSDAGAVDAALRAAGLVHGRNQAGFQQGARRGKGDGVGRFILKIFVQPVAFSWRFHVSDSAAGTRRRQAGV